MPNGVRIAASLLAADFARLGEEVAAVESAGADYIHFDIMDGHFVPNLTIGPAVVEALRVHCDLPFDVHLMISPVDAYIPTFSSAGADIITFHAEAGPHLHRTVQLVRSHDVRVGVSINPGTPAEVLKPILGEIDLVLVMTVNPGFGGQRFIDSQLDKVRQIRSWIDAGDRNIELEVDGGITLETAPRAIESGANVLVAGTATFAGGSDHYARNITGLRG
jgi:ribulose-phosphate 3-epimerase